MRLRPKRPSAELEVSRKSLSGRRVSWLENEADFLVSMLRKHRKLIRLSCAVIAYLIGWSAIFHLLSWNRGERVGFERFSYIDKIAVGAADQSGRRELKHREAIFPSLDFFELMVAGTAVGIAGVKLASGGRKRSVVVSLVIGLFPMLLAWVVFAWRALVVFSSG